MPLKDLLITYEIVFDAPANTGKDKIFNAVIKWCATQYRNSNDAIKLTKNTGEFVLNGSFNTNIPGSEIPITG